MKLSLLAFLLGMVCIPAFSQSTYNGALTFASPAFNRPNEGAPPTSLSVAATNVYYAVTTFSVNTPGSITFHANSEWDNFMILYDVNGLDPLSPLTNALKANDDLSGSGPNSGFTYTFTAAGTYSIVVCSFKNNVTGPFTITISATTVLPLQLLSFTAINAGGKSNIVSWSTAKESNLDLYQVQRSIDDKTFTDLVNGSITAKNSAAATSYEFTDNYPVTGYNYYRLKITERSGHTSYSHIALVKNFVSGIANLKVFPNPAADHVQIEAKSMLNKKAFVSIISSGGITMQSGRYSFNNQAILMVDVKKLPAGKYFLRITVDKDETAIPFVKK